MTKTKRFLLQAIGALSLLLGIIGIVLPLLPTTPFILLSAWCFSSSSEKWHRWLTLHPRFGPMLTNWQQYGAIPLHAKLLATVLLSSSIVILLVSSFMIWIKIMVVLGLLSILLFIWTRPSLSRPNIHNE